MGTNSQPKKAVSREELLRQWREQRRAAKQNQPRHHPAEPLSFVSHPSPNPTTLQPPSSSSPPSPKKVKVRVRRSNQTPPNKPATLRLYERGTVAWRLKAKHHPPPKPPSHPYQEPSSLPKERTTNPQGSSSLRRKSEPPLTVHGCLVERSLNLPIAAPISETTVKTVDVFHACDLVIVRQDSGCISPMSARSSAFGSPTAESIVSRRPRPRHYDFAIIDAKRSQPRDEEGPNETLTYNDLSPILPEGTIHFPNVISRSRSQRSIVSVARSLSYEDDHESSGNFSAQDLEFQYREDSVCLGSPKHEDWEPRDTSSCRCRSDEGRVLNDVSREDTCGSADIFQEALENRDQRENSMDSDRTGTRGCFSQNQLIPSAPFTQGDNSATVEQEPSTRQSYDQDTKIASPLQPLLDDSFEWIDNLSPDENPNRRVPIRRRDFLPKMASPLQHFRHEGDGRGNRSTSSSMDSELEERSHNKVSDDVTIGIEPNPNGRVSDQSSDIDSETDTVTHDTRNEQEGPVQFISDTFLKVDGKTLLQPVRETPIMHPQLVPVENACLCSCCSGRKEQKWEEMGRQLEELKWRAENAEVDKQKYQNQIYAIRKKYEARLTPFREVFEEMLKLKQEKESLLKENRENRVALESSISALQIQMTEALTIAMKQNMELKGKLKDAESQIKRLQSSSEEDCKGEVA